MTTSTSPIDLPTLEKLVHHQRELYRILRRLAEQQPELIQQGEAEQLLRLLHQRQRVVDELTAVNADLQPYRERWSEVWAEVPAERQGDLAKQLKESQEDLKAIIARDDQDRVGLEAARDRISNAVKKTTSGQGAVKAYRQTGNQRPTPGYHNASTHSPQLTDRQG